MKEIITVTGRIAPEELGFCQCHEHIAMSKGISYQINPALCMDDMEKSLEEAKRFHLAGGQSFIEAQPCGANRMALELRRLSEDSGVHIIASTGFHKLCFYPKEHWIRTLPPSDLEEVFVRELTEGMFVDADQGMPQTPCDARAGIIKTAYDTEELSPRYKELFRAAARAALRTHRILMIHVEQGTNPVLLQDYLLNLGIRPQDLMFCHMDRACPNLELHRRFLSKGSYLEFDTIGRFKYHSDAHEIQLFKALINAGYESQLLYSLDTTRTRLRSYVPDAIGLDYILTVFNQLLRDSGVSAETIHLISVENPKRILTQ